MNQIKDFLEYILNAFKIFVIIQPWESGLLVRKGSTIRKLNKGIYFKLPFFDSVYVQECRLRVIPLAIQTLTTKDYKAITINGAVGYSISNIETLYETLYHPETTVANMIMSELSDYIFNTDLNDINPKIIENEILNKLNIQNYGLKFEYFRIINFVNAKTYRIIKEESWTSENLSMNNKK